MSFLPDEYKKPVQGSKYLTPSKIESEVKFRILSSAITGYLDWMETEEGGKKPIRTKEQPKTSFDPERPARHFWAFVVWNYVENCIQIMEITQATIQDAIIGMINDEDWGDPKGYDIKIKKEGEKLKTRYALTPSNKSEISEEIKTALKESNVNLEKLFDGGNPFNDNANETAVPETVDKEKASLQELADAM